MAIALVVLGHALIFCGRCEWLMMAIYSFHMPLMFSISGYVTALSVARAGDEEPWVWIRRKLGRSALRLLVPYAFFALLVIPLVNTALLGDVVGSFAYAWRRALLTNQSLWFLPCCFLLVVVYLGSRRLHRAIGTWQMSGAVKEVLACAGALLPIGILYLLLPQIDYFRSTLSYVFSFFAGAWIFAWLHGSGETLDMVLTRLRAGAFPNARLTVVLSRFLFGAAVVGFVCVPRPAFKPFVGLLALVPLALVAHALAGRPFLARALSFVGQSTLMIYCLDFIVTTLSIRYLAQLHQAGRLSIPLLILLTFLYVPLFIAFVCFLRLMYLENLRQS